VVRALSIVVWRLGESCLRTEQGEKFMVMISTKSFPLLPLLYMKLTEKVNVFLAVLRETELAVQ
jgi:hypothetical protein